MHYLDRRHADRIEVPAARVICNIGGDHTVPLPLKDINIGGACFEVDRTIKKGQSIEFEILVPDMDKIYLKGNIVWTSRENNGNPGQTGVQFLPFSTDERFNSMYAHSQLSKLIHGQGDLQ